jgi:hypothetical protein
LRQGRSAVLLLAALALGGSVRAGERGFTGRWVADLSTQDASQSVDVYVVANGLYECRSCTPPRSYPADGQPHPVPGDAEVISEAVTVLGPRAIRTRIVSPTRVRETTMTVAADDRTARYVSIDRRTDLPGRLRTEYLARRIAPAPAGANRASGSWRGIRYVAVPDVLRTVELGEQGDRFTYRTPSGVHYTAILGGPAVPVEGPQGAVATAAVVQAGPRTVVETREAGGKTVLRRTFTLSPDGRSMTMETLNVETGAAFRATSRRK